MPYRLFTLQLLFMLCSYFSFITFAQEIDTAPLDHGVHKFNAGSQNAPGYTSLGLNEIYQEEKGYGWLTPPVAGFSRPDLSRFRGAPLQDGVSGKMLSFQADLPAGQWWLTLWMEAGLEDTNTATLKLNNEQIPLNWHAFDPPAEPRREIVQQYRLLHKPVAVEQNGLRLELIGQADSVRILAFHLQPAPHSTSESEPFFARLKQLGSYKSMLYTPGPQSVFAFQSAATDSLAVVRDALLSANLDTLTSAYWHEQLDLLIQAERLLAMRGWDWANDSTGLALFGRIHQAIMLFDGIIDRPDAASYPLYERALLSRGRLLYWLKAEGSSPKEIPLIRQPDLAKLHALHPDEALFSMYNGGKIDLPDACDEIAGPVDAPTWASLQQETLCRLRDIAHWWTQEQQTPNGEFGGKYGDDVELLRWWPALILSGDTVSLTGWKRLADGVWTSGKIRDGYAKAVSDVEHASEFVSDTAPVMALFTDDPVYTDRLRPSARHFENLWTGITPAGHRLFKSAWFSSSALETEPPKNRDVSYNTRAVKAVRYLAWKTGEPHITDRLTEWAHAWASAAMRTDKGKPKGIMPASIRYPDEAFNGDEPTWYKANMYWSYFDWAHTGGSMILEQLLFSFSQTRDEALLEPLIETLKLIEAELPGLHENTNLDPGSPAWVARHLIDNTRFWSVVSQWRLLTGNTQFDDLLENHGTPYLQYRLTGNEDVLIEGLQEILDKVRYNTPLLTYEAIHTDRVYVTDSGSGSSHLKAMLTGDGIVEDMSPYPVVTWQDTDPFFTALVQDASPSMLKAKFFPLTEPGCTFSARLWQLEPGRYRLTLASDGGAQQSRIIEIQERGQRIQLSIPGAQTSTLLIERE